MEYIGAVADSGAQYAKFQIYRADLLASHRAESYWDEGFESETSQHQLFSRYERFSLSRYRDLQKECHRLGVGFAASVFDLQSLAELIPLLDLVKIASADITHLRLLRAVAASGVPVAISTGAASMPEIRRAVSELSGSNLLGLLHCVLRYPTALGDSALQRISQLRDLFPDLPIGYSDHTLPAESSIACAVAAQLGAVVFEKHFSLVPGLPGNDHYHSVDAPTLRKLTALTDTLSEASQISEKVLLDTQARARREARRGLYASRDIQPGERLSSESLVELRPVDEYGAEDIDGLIGKRVLVKVGKGEAIRSCDLQP